MKVKFLHIPKTAGTSVRRFLGRFFLPWQVCPAWHNPELLAIPPERLGAYRVFAGHFDWTALDAIEGPAFTFSVLREPKDRLLSYYFWLRSEGGRVDQARLALPQMRGFHAAVTLPPDKFFTGGGTRDVRRHIDDLFDNFYAYYFAGRGVHARQRLQRDQAFSEDRLLDQAARNLDLLDGVYSVDDLDPLQADIVAAFGQRGIGRLGAAGSRLFPIRSLKLRRGPGDFASRVEALQALGATSRTFERLEEMTRLDTEIWTARFQRRDRLLSDRTHPMRS